MRYFIKHMSAATPKMPKHIRSIPDMHAAAEAMKGKTIAEMDAILKGFGHVPVETRAFVKTQAQVSQVPIEQDKQSKLRQLGFNMTSRYSYKQASDMLRRAFGNNNVEQRLEALMDLQMMNLLTD